MSATRHLPARQRERVVYVPDLRPPATDLTLVDPAVAVAAARRAERHARLLQDKARRAILEANDSKVRRFWVGFGAVTGGAVVVGAVGITAWLCHLVGAVGLVVLPATFIAGVITVLVFHRCVFSLHHGHR